MTPEQIDALSDTDFYKNLRTLNAKAKDEGLTMEEERERDLYIGQRAKRELRKFSKAYNAPEAVREQAETEKAREEFEKRKMTIQPKFKPLDNVRVKEGIFDTAFPGTEFAIDFYSRGFDQYHEGN